MIDLSSRAFVVIAAVKYLECSDNITINEWRRQTLAPTFHPFCYSDFIFINFHNTADAHVSASESRFNRGQMEHNSQVMWGLDY
jgi:hypothetical protein